MNLETYIPIILLIAICVTGLLSCLSCQKYGEEIGERRGHKKGWDDAHDRIAAALRIDITSLKQAIIELENADYSSDPNVTFGKFVRSVSGHKRKPSKAA